MNDRRDKKGSEGLLYGHKTGACGERGVSRDEPEQEADRSMQTRTQSLAGDHGERGMSVSARSSLIMLDLCRMFSARQNKEVCLSEPDEPITYYDFAERLNPYDWINDTVLWELLEKIFHRKGSEE